MCIGMRDPTGSGVTSRMFINILLQAIMGTRGSVELTYVEPIIPAAIDIVKRAQARGSNALYV